MWQVYAIEALKVFFAWRYLEYMYGDGKNGGASGAW